MAHRFRFWNGCAPYFCGMAAMPVSAGIFARKGAGAMRLKKYALFLLALSMSCTGAASTPAGAAAFGQDGTACISVTVDARSEDHGGIDPGAGSDSDGDSDSPDGDKGGSDSDLSDGDKGGGDGDSSDDDKGGGDGNSSDGDKGGGGSGSSDGDKGDGDGDLSDGGKGGGDGGSSGGKGGGDKGSDGNKKDDGDSGSSGGSRDDGGSKGGGRGRNPRSWLADRDSLPYPGTALDREQPADRKPDYVQETEKGAGDTDTVKETGGSKDNDSGDKGTDGSGQGQESEDGEPGSPKDSGSGAGISAPFAAFCCLAAALAFAAILFLFHRRKKYFHGILTDEMEGISFRGDQGRAVFVPALTEKLNQGAVTFHEYEDMVMGSRAGTLLPAGTEMHICVIHEGASEMAFAGKADESRLFEELRKAADEARIQKQIVMADVSLEHSGKGIKIPLHFVFR